MAQAAMETIAELEKQILDLKEKDIFVGPLITTVENLKRHTESIEAIEKHSNAIREEVIEPIKEELVQNKKAGKFSIFGFYVGAIGLLASVFSLFFYIFSSTPGTFWNPKGMPASKAQYLSLPADHAFLPLFGSVQLQAKDSTWVTVHLDIIDDKEVVEYIPARSGVKRIEEGPHHWIPFVRLTITMPEPKPENEFKIIGRYPRPTIGPDGRLNMEYPSDPIDFKGDTASVILHEGDSVINKDGQRFKVIRILRSTSDQPKDEFVPAWTNGIVIKHVP